MSDETPPAWAVALTAEVRAIREGNAATRVTLETLRDDVEAVRAELVSTRAAIMDRIDRLQERVDGHANDLSVNLAAAQIAGRRTADFREENAMRDLAAAQEAKETQRLIHAMQLQINRLQTEVRDIRGEGRH